jgi:hypothetical protein
MGIFYYLVFASLISSNLYYAIRMRKNKNYEIGFWYLILNIFCIFYFSYYFTKSLIQLLIF